MHSGYGVPGIQHPQQQQQAVENSLPGPVLLSMNPHILEQIHCGTNLPASTQQLFFDQHGHFVVQPHQSRLSHHYVHGGTAGSSSSAFLPVNFKLGLDDICSATRHTNSYRDGHGTITSSVSNNINEAVAVEDAAANLHRGSEQYQVPEDRQYSPLGMLHCWQNQQDSAIEQQPCWEPLPAEASNENSEIVDRQEHIEMTQKKASPTNYLESKSRVHFGELEAIYKRLGTDESNQTGPIEPVNPSEAFIREEEERQEEQEEEEASASMRNIRKKRKKKEVYKENRMITPMAEFFEGLVKQVMDHQENLHRKFNEVVERLDEERWEREMAWRNQETARFEQEAAVRVREKALAESREATIVSYLEKITGQKINFPMCSTPGEITLPVEVTTLVGPMELEQARVVFSSE